MPKIGLSAFVRCKNEEEYIVASLLSIYRVVDEILVSLNNSEDRTRELIEGLIPHYPKIRMTYYDYKCSAIGLGYFERVQQDPTLSLARYYNWCIAQATFTHVCKWDGDMIATPAFENVRTLLSTQDVVVFDGYDVLGQDTTNDEPRIFRYDPARARYVDWDLYEVLEHDYSKIHRLGEKCYLHMKLVKKNWIHNSWSNPNLLATRSVPATGTSLGGPMVLLKSMKRRLTRVLVKR